MSLFFLLVGVWCRGGACETKVTVTEPRSALSPRISCYLQDLANILHSSQLVDDDIIEEHLELSGFEFSDIPLGPPGTGPKLEQRELGRLAMEVDKPTMIQVITAKLGVGAAQVANAQSDNRANSWSAVFEILVRWSNRRENTREVQDHPPLHKTFNSLRLFYSSINKFMTMDVIC